MIDAAQLVILSATADLRTTSTTPSTQQVADWVAGRYALRGEPSPYAGPQPWFGLEKVLRELEGAGLIETGGDDSPAPHGEGRSLSPRDDDRWVAITPSGIAALKS